MDGYLHPLFAESFSGIGKTLYLPRSKGWLIKRKIPKSPYYDAMGPYPFFMCENWDDLTYDLNNLKEQLVSVSMVINPLSPFPLALYKDYFDKFQPYKDHYILDLDLPLTTTISKNKRKYALKALRNLTVRLEIAPNIDLDSWVRLYDFLIVRHEIKGIRAFSREAFRKQLSIPNTHCFNVFYNERKIGANVYYIQGDVGYGHLSAFSPEGYELGAPYAVKWVAIEYFSQKVRVINFGGGTGARVNIQGGLDLFKQGWSNRTEKSFFCGKILDPGKYQTLCAESDNNNENWFPAYRMDDF